MTMYFSPQTGGFYASELMSAYEASESGWPQDGLEVEQSDYAALMAGQSKGKVIVAGSGGYPELTEPQKQTQQALILTARSERETLFEAAGLAIIPLQDAVDLDDATDLELETLNAWKKYRVALNRLDLSAAPDIDWPQIPA